MSCAGDCGFWAATRGSLLRVTSTGWGPATTRGEREGIHWFRERNGRKVMKFSDGTYWRAPRPRPRPNRRKRRHSAKQILQQLLTPEEPQSTPTSEAAEVVQVLQKALRNALIREAQCKVAAQKHSAMESKLRATRQQLQDTHKKMGQQRRKFEAELNASKEKLAETQSELVQLQEQWWSEVKGTKPKHKKAEPTQPKVVAEADYIEPRQPQTDYEFNYACTMLSSAVLTWQETCFYSAVIVWQGQSWYLWSIRNVGIVVMALLAKLVYDNFQGTMQIIFVVASYMIAKNVVYYET